MPWGHPAAQMREYILALRAIWASWNEGRPLSFRGEYYRHTLMTAIRLHELSVTRDEQRWAATGDLIDDEVLSAFAVIGPPQEATAELKRRYGDVVDRVTVPMAAGMPADRVRDLLASLR
jgi:hypothetical protein